MGRHAFLRSFMQRTLRRWAAWAQLAGACGIMLMAGAASAGQENFDLASYTPPPGWKKEDKGFAVVYSKVDPKVGFGQIALYSSTAGKGDAELDFTSEWQEIVAGNFHPKDKPSLVPDQTRGDWLLRVGAATFSGEGGRVLAMLGTFSGHGRAMSVLALTSSDAFVPEVERFLSSVTLRRPAAAGTTPAQKTAAPLASAKPGAASAPAHGFSLATTRFDDGWTSTIHPDWVEAANGNTRVYLYYAFEVGADMRPPHGHIRDNLWNRYVAPRFRVLSENTNRKSMIDEWKEGEAIDKATGRKVYLAMNWDGDFILAVTPDEQTSYGLFPDSSALKRMKTYNKFAISPGDLTGTWQEGGTSTAHWYERNTGNYAGMSFAGTSATFHFRPDGTYTSIHNGATGTVGNMGSFQQEYKGRYDTSPWLLTATNRHKGASDQYQARFQAVRGGRVLHLTSNNGQTYALVKVK